jgi:hypothetical protein
MKNRNIEHHGDSQKFGDCSVAYHWLDDRHPNDGNDVIIIAAGGLIAAEKVQIVYPGDILWSWQLSKLLRIAKPIPNTEVLQIVKTGGPEI